MAEQINVQAMVREEQGTPASKRLRREGWVPAILYGQEMDSPLPLQVKVMDLRQMLARGERSLINVQVSGSQQDASYPAMVKELQRHPVKGHYLHLDLYQVSLTRKVTSTSPVTILGEPVGVREFDGVLQHQLWEVDIECLPGQLPDHLEVDVSALEIGDNVTVADLQVPEGVEILTPEEEVVASVVPPMSEEEMEPAVAEEEEWAEEEVAGEEMEVPEAAGEEAAGE